QHDWLAVPAPGHAEADEGLRINWALQRGLAPALAAIGRDHHPGDASSAGIGNAGDFVEAWALERVPERRMGDERLDLLQEVKLPVAVARNDLRIGLGFVEAHRRLVEQLDTASELDVHVALIAGQQEAHRIAVTRHEPLAVLIERDHGIVQALLDRDAA